ncbi:PepSY domain-containing protein [Novosphingobium flavum]|uniref:PepSY domain-containing protein n=1 Tax=Novosphingobium aerophilum TaxID=2839843 RepID=UPI00163AF03D|nr:PepSY domain-containing protein [Novosphingobium aerophilum]MBC2660631.1 PepSY domain-containing protein [Novosphingobium aerophilum]
MERSIGKSLLLGAAIAGTVAVGCGPARAATGEDAQAQLRREIRAGNVRPPREVEARVIAMMAGMQYLGPEYDSVAMAYRFKFIRDGRVVFVDVDARTGQVLDRR